MALTVYNAGNSATGKLLDKEKFDMIYTCGPEVMVKKIFELTEQRKLPIEASLERLMRCGIGLCGSCVIGKYRVCRDGPIFNAAQLREPPAPGRAMSLT